jgi:hypothetical protein
LYHTLVVIIISYVFYNIIASKAYLEFDAVLGAAELKLKWSPGVIDTTALHYCTGKDGGTFQISVSHPKKICAFCGTSIK